LRGEPATEVELTSDDSARDRPRRRADRRPRGWYRFWRDLGYPAGAVAAGIIGAAFGLVSTVYVAALLMLISGLVANVSMRSSPFPTPRAPQLSGAGSSASPRGRPSVNEACRDVSTSSARVADDDQRSSTHHGQNDRNDDQPERESAIHDAAFLSTNAFND
jgi:predicted lipid-binding transport protein (Tim44 family)